MNKDAVIGVGILATSVIVIAVYLWLIFLPPLAGVDLLVLKITGSVAVAAVFGILAWIGYTLATTPPKPIEEIEKEMEKETEQEKSGEEASKQKT